MTSSSDADATMKAQPAAAPTFAGGRYVVLRTLPEGGQKTVYLVHDTALDRDCALALLKAERFEPDDLERLRREAQAMARLGAHPNIVAVHDIGDENGRPYLICEYVAGGDLRAELQRAGGPLEVERVLAIATDVLHALALAHERGILHRDIKPANIWMAEGGAAKLGDFGLASVVDRTRITVEGSVMGTASYMSPEQALGQACDARSDLYSLGCVLYETVTGRPPFIGDSPLAIISQHVNKPPGPASWQNPAVPVALDRLIVRLLGKSPEARPQSATEVIDEIAQMIERARQGPFREPPTSPDVEGISWGRFVGRQPELVRMRAALQKTLGGSFGVAMLVGEAGVGKTRLATEFITSIGVPPVNVLKGRCSEGDGGLSYRPFIEAFRRHFRSLSTDELRAQTSFDPAMLAMLVADIAERLDDVLYPVQGDAEAQRLRLFEAVTQFLRKAAARTPILLFLDDLHWADNASLLMLQYVVRTIGSAPLLILGAYRDDEVEDAHPLGDTLALLRRGENYERLSLHGLEQDDVLGMLAAIDGADERNAGALDLAEEIHKQTGGNPFFIRQILDHLREEGQLFQSAGGWGRRSGSSNSSFVPEGVRDVVMRRVFRLTHRCQKMLTRASTMTGGFSWPELNAITGDSEGFALDALDEALDAQLIREHEDGGAVIYDFAHALIRQTLYGAMSKPRRAILHRQIGDALEQLYSDQPEPYLSELAHHFCEAASIGDTAKAITYATRAGDRAQQLLAFEEATAHYEKALAVIESGTSVDGARATELLICIGHTQDQAGRHAAAIDTLRKASVRVRELSSPTLLARVAVEFGHAVDRSGRNVETSNEAIGMLSAALSTLDRGDSELRVRTLCRLSTSAMSHSAFVQASPPEARVADARTALAMAERLADPSLQILALNTLRETLCGPQHVEERLSAATDMVRLAMDTGGGAAEFEGRAGRLNALLELGRIDGVDDEFDRIEQIVTQSKPPNTWYATAYRAMRALFCGDFEAAEALVPAAMTAGQSRGLGLAAGDFANQIYELRRQQGRLSELGGMLKLLAAQFRATPLYQVALAQMYVETGELEEGRAQFELIAKHDFDDFRKDQFWLVAISVVSEVCADLQDVARARTLYDLLLPYADLNVVLNGMAVAGGSASRNLGQLATVLRRWDEATQHFESALEMNARLGARPFLVHTQYEYARMLDSRGHASDKPRTIDLVDEALTGARTLGMAGLIRKAEALRAVVITA